MYQGGSMLAKAFARQGDRAARMYAVTDLSGPAREPAAVDILFGKEPV